MITRRSLLIFLVLVTPLAFAGRVSADAQPTPSEKLRTFHEGLLKRYPRVDHMSADALVRLPRESVLLFDVRKSSEYDVSHLHSAIRVPPDMRAAEFLKNYHTMIRGKKIVFYCSVGERSSKLADAVLRAAGPSSFEIFNLEGGIFKWHNERRAVFDKDGQTQNIHPFSRFWGRLLIHQEHIRRN